MTRNQIQTLILIVFAQFMCTSLWFAGNAIVPQLAAVMNFTSADLGWMTSSVQLGFILGTVFYAFFTIADRYSPSKIFLISALLGSVFNVLITLPGLASSSMLAFRLLTGFFLAGIYPVGMKIAADYFEKGLGKAMSFLVGALVVGTGLPHLIASYDAEMDWRVVLYMTSCLAVVGGFLIWLFVGDGPFRKRSQKPDFRDMRRVFSNGKFRVASFGYFGHMWELYAFWAFVPIMLKIHFQDASLAKISSYSFLIIALGGVSCFASGFLASHFGTKKMASLFLSLSMACCLASPFVFQWPSVFFVVFMIFWGLVVIADSPLFSTLVAENAQPELKGTALTVVTSIGFAITIVSIQVLSYLVSEFDSLYVYSFLALGPLLGMIALVNK